jgi:hypothetical protein
MPSHRLVVENRASAGEWLLEWDEATLRVTGPGGDLVFEIPVARAHRIVELHELDVDGKVSFATDVGSLTFKRNKEAARDVRELVFGGLRVDGEYREAQKRTARVMIPVGTVALVVCGGLFSLYCWWASWAPDPPKGHWLYSVGWLVHLVLLLLLGVALGGLYLVYISVRQLGRIRRIERAMGAEG